MRSRIFSFPRSLSRSSAQCLRAAVDASVLNLSDTQTGGRGPADATLVGATTGPVAGSLVVSPDGSEARSVLTKGVSYYRAAGVAHNVINAGAEELVFIEIEIKAHPITDGA